MKRKEKSNQINRKEFLGCISTTKNMMKHLFSISNKNPASYDTGAALPQLCPPSLFSTGEGRAAESRSAEAGQRTNG